MAVALAALALLGSRAARADERAECLAAYDEGQRAKLDHRFRASRERLLTCSRSSCPPAVVSECTTWLAEIDAAMPTIVVGARDATGRDLVDAAASLDEHAVAHPFDGRAIPVDPGPHTLRITRAGSPEARVDFVAREGEKRRLVEVRLELAGDGRTSPAPRSATFPIVVGGIGAAALASVAVFGTLAAVKVHDLNQSCGPRCTDAQVAPARAEALAADVSLGAGVVAAGVVVAYLIFAPRPRSLAAWRSAPASGALAWSF